ncbi:MAG: hypothetical protein AAFZ09_19170 [Pseudomonadota bacterium]
MTRGRRFAGALAGPLALALAAPAGAQDFADVEAFYDLEGDLAFSELHAAATGDDPNGFFDYLPEGTDEARQICLVNSFLIVTALNTIRAYGALDDAALPPALGGWAQALYPAVYRKCHVGLAPDEAELMRAVVRRAGAAETDGTRLIDRIEADIRARFATPPPWMAQ